MSLKLLIFKSFKDKAFFLRFKMHWGIYGIFIIFGLFILLLIFNPNLSCFGKQVRSPLYPLLRRKKKKIKTEDYGFYLVDDTDKEKAGERKKKEEDAEEVDVHSEFKVDSD